jgi:CheY-like chemotaxis protein
MTARILIIEDNPTNLELMRFLLHASGSSLFTAADGPEGIETARRMIPDLIVCDLQMPGLDGYEVARRLKSDPVLRQVPLVAVTAYAMVGDRDGALAAGFDGYLTKPIMPRLFASQLKAFLRPARPPGPEPKSEATSPPSDGSLNRLAEANALLRAGMGDHHETGSKSIPTSTHATGPNQ